MTGKFMILGASRSGKSTLLKAAKTCFVEGDRNYGCEKKDYTVHSTDMEPKDKWSSGRYIFKIRGAKISFYIPADSGGDRDYFEKNLTENLPGTQTICWCFDASQKEIEYGNNNIASLRDYTGGGVGRVIKEMKNLKKDGDDLRVRNFIFLGTHMDKLKPKPNEEKLKGELGYDDLRKELKSFDPKIRVAFSCGSFISYDSSVNFWEDIFNQLEEQ